MSENEGNFDRFKCLPPKKRQMEHRALAISMLLANYDEPISIYRIHKDLTNETYHQQLKSIEKTIGVNLGKLGFAQVLRLVKEMQDRRFVSSREGKRNAKLIDLSFNGLLFGWLSKYISDGEAMRYLARKIPFIGVFQKILPRDEPRERQGEREWNLVESVMFPYIIPETLQMKEPEPLGSEYVVPSEEEYFMIIELGYFRRLLILLKKGEVGFDDLKKLSCGEQEILKKTRSNYLEKAKDWYDLYDFALHNYDEIMTAS